ncbi:MAG: OmpA family protein [Prevotellaceae bacterium]|nr:OmpA family protein [Prevotellaceae bacterium]
MKNKKIILSVLLMMVSMTITAQTADKYEYVFKPHFYIQAQGGAQYTLGEVPFKDLVSPNVQLGIGYQFSKVIGMRLAANAWQSKGGSELYTNKYKWKWNYVAPGIDFTFNLTHIIGGYNPERIVDVNLFLGGAANIAWKNDEAITTSAALLTQGLVPMEYLWDGTKVRFVGRGGLNIDFHLSKAVSLGIEANANCLSDHYNSKHAKNADWYFNALAGLKINLGSTHTKKKIVPPAPEIKYVDRVVEKVVEKIVEKPVPVQPEKKAIKDLYHRDVFFKINSTVIRKEEMVKVKEVADYLKANPSAIVTIVGYADKGTGTPAINARLAAGRAASVKSTLMKKYGIDQVRIVVDSKGDTYQPYPEAEKNRVSVCVVE